MTDDDSKVIMGDVRRGVSAYQEHTIHRGVSSSLRVDPNDPLTGIMWGEVWRGQRALCRLAREGNEDQQRRVWEWLDPDSRRAAGALDGARRGVSRLD
jgi:hypothetical protein